MHGRNHIDYEYFDGLIIRKTAFINGYTQYTESYEYDDNGRFISRITENTDDYQRIEKFTYDENGNIKNRTDNDMEISYAYDSNDKLIEIRQYD